MQNLGNITIKMVYILYSVKNVDKMHALLAIITFTCFVEFWMSLFKHQKHSIV